MEGHASQAGPACAKSPTLQTARLSPLLGGSAPFPCLPTKLTALDAVLHSGLPAGSLTEVYGLPGTGKTALLLSLAASAAQAGGAALLLDCDGALVSSRAAQILAARDEQSAALVHVSLARVASWEALTACASYLLPGEAGRQPDAIRLVAVDSVAFPFRETSGSAPHKRLEAFAARMQAAAAELGFCAVLVNHARAPRPSSPVVPALGNAWQHICSTRLCLRLNDRGRRVVDVVKSPVAPCTSVRFEIGEAGLIDADDDDT